MNKSTAYIVGAVYLPIETINVNQIKKELHVKETRTMSKFTEVKEIELYKHETISNKEYLAIPRVYGEDYLEDYDIIDWTATGDIGCLSDLIPLVPRDHQPPFIDNVESLLRDLHDVMADAYSGAGKTVMGIEIARRLNTSTMIIVDQQKLADQWIDTLTRIFGLPEDQVGFYTGDSKEYEGKPVCIATLQSLYRSTDNMDDFYDSFGFTIVDEAHGAGSQKYGTVLMEISSQYRLGVSATTDRGDTFQKVLDAHLGKTQYKLPNNHVESAIWYIEYPRVLSSYANTAKQSGTYETALSEDGVRNLMLAKVVNKAYKKGRDILVIGSRTLQLQGLMSLCKRMGIPEEDMGMYSQSIYEAGIVKDKEPKLRLDEWDEDSFYTAVEYSVHKIVSKKRLKAIQDKSIEAKIIFAPYHIFAKGVNVPRLSVGIDATPRSKVVQAHGRILRAVEGKPQPIWITVRDFNNIRSEVQFRKRLSEYPKSNAKYIYQLDLDKGIRGVGFEGLTREANRNINRLRRCDYLSLGNGNYELVPVENRKGR